jgi:hypothetical protein
MTRQTVIFNPEVWEALAWDEKCTHQRSQPRYNDKGEALAEGHCIDCGLKWESEVQLQQWSLDFEAYMDARVAGKDVTEMWKSSSLINQREGKR